MYFQAPLLVSLSEVVSWCIRTTHLPLTEKMKRKTLKKANMKNYMFYRKFSLKAKSCKVLRQTESLYSSLQ